MDTCGEGVVGEILRKRFAVGEKNNAAVKGLLGSQQASGLVVGELRRRERRAKSCAHFLFSNCIERSVFLRFKRHIADLQITTCPLISVPENEKSTKLVT